MAITTLISHNTRHAARVLWMLAMAFKSAASKQLNIKISSSFFKVEVGDDVLWVVPQLRLAYKILKESREVSANFPNWEGLLTIENHYSKKRMARVEIT